MSRERLKFIILRTLGNFFFLFALYGMAMTFGPAFYLEMIFRFNQARNIRYAVFVPSVTPMPEKPVPTSIPTPTPKGQNTFFGQLSGGNKVEYLSPVSAQFGIIIPKIGANAPIIPNVDPSNPDKYLPKLKDGVAHAMGTYFPGAGGNIYLFAHSTDAFWNVGRYNAIFYLLKELEIGDEIDIFFDGVRHIYRVVTKLTVSPSEVHYLTDPTPYEQLTLQTCWPPGTTLKRLIIQARPERDLSI
jgi:sortase A